MRVTRLEVLQAEFPFRISFGHALATRRASTNVLVRLELDSGAVGYGEGVPREYVTGETPAGAVSYIAERLGPALVGRSLEHFEDTPALIDALFGEVEGVEQNGSACCAVELALLDAMGRAFGRSVGDLLGPRLRQQVRYSSALPFLPGPLMLLGALLHRAYGINILKLKVGRQLEQDLRSLRTVRRALGPRADLRVDANCSWGVEQAIHAINQLGRYGLSAVEQPVARDDFAGLKRVADTVDVPIMADESLCTLDDARRLAGDRMVDMFNIRISKCGGLLAAQRMASIAAEAGLSCQLGTHPGESAILAAAGRHFATTQPRLRFLEGSAGWILLKQDIALQSMRFGRGGLAPALDGPGLGVDVIEAKLERFVSHRQTVGQAGR